MDELGSLEERTALAKAESTPLWILHVLCQDERAEIANLALGNPSIPSQELIKLAKNDSTLKERILRLTKDYEVLKELIDSVELVDLTNLTSFDTNELSHLANEDSPIYLRMIAASQPNTPVHLLGQMAFTHNKELRTVVARNPSLPRDCINSLLKDRYPTVREAAALNPFADEDILKEVVSTDSWAKVRTAAQRNLMDKSRITSIKRLES